MKKKKQMIIITIKKNGRKSLKLIDLTGLLNELYIKNHCFIVSSWLFGFSHILLVNILLHVAIFFPVTMNETSVWKYNIKDQKWKLAWLSLRYVEFKIEDLKLNMI